jgi:GTPase
VCLFERPEGGDAAILVHVGANDGPARAELAELAHSAGAWIAAELGTTRPVPDARHHLGSGKLEELRALVHDAEADLVVFGTELSPSQERNLEGTLECRVIDRTRLILDIFAQRASSYEGKLQVELAQLEHMSTRLVRGWTHLERQKGGIGLRGPGEKQLETDRRLLNARIRQIRDRLDGVRARRALSRRARQRAALPVVSLVGYTNAGKSTLFNQLTGADVRAEDLLFATLDPTLRRLPLPAGAQAVVADTVGFVRKLPHDLVEAFQATLEESREAALLVHVVDAADPERHDKSAEVNTVLETIGAGEVPRLTVYNKIDQVEGATVGVDLDDLDLPRSVRVCAATGEGLEGLREAIAQRLQGHVGEWLVHVPWKAGALRAALFDRLEVLEETLDDDKGWALRVRAAEAVVRRIIFRVAPSDERDQVRVRDVSPHAGGDEQLSLAQGSVDADVPGVAGY